MKIVRFANFFANPRKCACFLTFHCHKNETNADIFGSHDTRPDFKGIETLQLSIFPEAPQSPPHDTRPDFKGIETFDPPCGRPLYAQELMTPDPILRGLKP